MEYFNPTIRRHIAYLVASASLILAILLPATVYAGDWHDYVNVDWRVDLNTIYKSGNYAVSMAAGRQLNDRDPYASGWLALNLASGSTPVGAEFSQAGIVEQSGAFHWFVFSYVGVECLVPGTSQGDGLTCNGDPDMDVGLNQTTLVQLALLPDGWWYAYLYYPTNSGFQPIVLARIYSQSQFIYRAYEGSESSSAGTTDGAAWSAFYFNHPGHTYPGQYVLVDWEGSGLNCPRNYTPNPNSSGNCLYVEQESNGQSTGAQICPFYNGIINLLGDYRVWFAGVDGYQSGYVCYATFYNSGTAGSP